MDLRDIVVLLNGSARDDIALNVAARLARRNDAHLTGLCPLEPQVPGDVPFALGGYSDLWTLPDIAARIDRQTGGNAASIQERFRVLLAREGIRGDWWTTTGSPMPAILRRTQATDLVVAGQTDPDTPSPDMPRNLAEDVLMGAGRPLLLIPYAGRFETIGTNVLVGWTPTREAARALHDAIPLFAPGAKITVLTIGTSATPSGLAPPLPTDIVRHLTRHGLDAVAARTVITDGLRPSDALLDYAADLGSDLLVTGGYGHSRTREMVMGGVTRDLLRHMTLPVLMSH